MMNIRYLIRISCLFFVFYGCESEEVTPNDPLNGSWNLINVSGGFAGISEDFEQGSIVWIFNEAQGTLQVNKQMTPNSIYEGLASGSYDYEMVVHDGNNFLFVDQLEIGGVSISNNEMLINQNLMINGSGADKFVLKLVK